MITNSILDQIMPSPCSLPLQAPVYEPLGKPSDAEAIPMLRDVATQLLSSQLHSIIFLITSFRTSQHQPFSLFVLVTPPFGTGWPVVVFNSPPISVSQRMQSRFSSAYLCLHERRHQAEFMHSYLQTLPAEYRLYARQKGPFNLSCV